MEWKVETKKLGTFLGKSMTEQSLDSIWHLIFCLIIGLFGNIFKYYQVSGGTYMQPLFQEVLS